MPDGPRGDKNTSGMVYPLPKESVTNLGSNNFGEDRGDHIHAGNDFSAPCGTPIYAVNSGEVIYAGWMEGYGNYIALRMQDGWVAGYGHLSAIRVDKGDNVDAGQHMGAVGNTGHSFGCHLHFNIGKGLATSYSDNIDPIKYLGGAVGPSGDTEGGGGGGGGTANLEQILNASKAAAFALDFQFPGAEERNEAFALQGQKSLLNDQPLFDFVKQMAGACLRDFQSLPNGDFYAFYPNYFGTYQSREPYWNVYDIELTEGTMDLTDDTLATHVYIVGDTIAFDGSVDATERVLTSGAVTIHNMAQPGFRESKQAPAKQDGDDSDNTKQETEKLMKSLNMTDAGQVLDFLGRYGARPHYEEATNVRNPMYEAFLAYQRFQLLWSEQFATTFRFTFMPELYPSGIIAFPDHELQCYVQEVTHRFSYESGFTTDAILMAPAATGKDRDDADPLKFGLVPANSANLDED